jgi:hypothetical protein
VHSPILFFVQYFSNQHATGHCSALDTLASQSFGAKSFKYIGTLTQRTILMQTLLCIPIGKHINRTLIAKSVPTEFNRCDRNIYLGCCWSFFTRPVLTAAGIDPEQAAMAQEYSR